LFLNKIAIFKNKLFTAAPIFSQGVTIFLSIDDITGFDGSELKNPDWIGGVKLCRYKVSITWLNFF
jgi:hypothetical protein